MGRPKGHRLTPEQRARCRPHNLHGGKPPTLTTPELHAIARQKQKEKKRDLKQRQRDATLRFHDLAHRPGVHHQHKVRERDAITSGGSVISEETLRNPSYKIRKPDGRVYWEKHDAIDRALAEIERAEAGPRQQGELEELEARLRQAWQPARQQDAGSGENRPPPAQPDTTPKPA